MFVRISTNNGKLDDENDDDGVDDDDYDDDYIMYIIQLPFSSQKLSVSRLEKERTRNKKTRSLTTAFHVQKDTNRETESKR